MDYRLDWIGNITHGKCGRELGIYNTRQVLSQRRTPIRTPQSELRFQRSDFRIILDIKGKIELLFRYIKGK